MKAVVYEKYGSPDVLELKEVEKPTPKDDEVLIKIHATTVNRTDCATIRAIPFFARLVTGIFKPKKEIPGTEFAGKIEEIGKNVTYFKVGEKVFGFDDQGSRSHAQYMTMSENKTFTIPRTGLSPAGNTALWAANPLGNNIEFHLPIGRIPTIRTSLGTRSALLGSYFAPRCFILRIKF